METIDTKQDAPEIAPESPRPKLLIIEDEPQVRLSIGAYLEDRGYRVIEAEDGPDGLALLESEQPDLVTCDLRLPGMDGLDVISCITGESPDTPVIVISGASHISDAIQALRRGAWDFITKPILDLELLDRSITKGLEQQRLRRENRQHQQKLEQANAELSRALARLREDEEAARELQRQILPPRQMEFEPYRFKRRIFPSSYLSGDFIDLFPIEPHQIGFYLADVSGHGVASAFVTAMLKTLFEKYREALAQEELDLCHPAQLMARLNHDICQMAVDKYLTLFYAVLDRQENSLVYCSGGHFPPPVLGDEAGLRTLPGHDKPVGLFEESVYTEHRIELPERFELLLLSDGLLELLPRESCRKRSALLLEHLEQSGLQPETLVEEFALEDHQGLPDDVTFLYLAREVDDESR